MGIGSTQVVFQATGQLRRNLAPTASTMVKQAIQFALQAAQDVPKPKAG
jgi:hypothetical protein